MISHINGDSRGGYTKLAQKMGFFSKIAKNGYFMGLCSKNGFQRGDFREVDGKCYKMGIFGIKMGFARGTKNRE